MCNTWNNDVFTDESSRGCEERKGPNRTPLPLKSHVNEDKKSNLNLPAPKSSSMSAQMVTFSLTKHCECPNLHIKNQDCVCV